MSRLEQVDVQEAPYAISNLDRERCDSAASRAAVTVDAPRIAIIGAGSRGQVYARAVLETGIGRVVAVAEPHDYKRRHLMNSLMLHGEQVPSEGVEFTDWRDLIVYERRRRARALAGDAGIPPGLDAAFVCVLDEMHQAVVLALARLGGVHVLCEKPLATRLGDCTDMYRALRQTRQGGEPVLFSVGHVLRYSPHNVLLRKLLLEDRIIGDVLSVLHTEPVGWWHFAHSYVRGNWRREDTSAPSLLTKSCHDMDLLLWLLCSPPSATGTAPPHLPATVTSTASLQYYRKSRKPAAAGQATNCLSCPTQDSCKYAAPKLYVGPDIVGLDTGNRRWPVSVLVPDIESYDRQEARDAVLAELARDYDATTPAVDVAARNWFGRCVYESDNDVCDEQVVTVTWDEDPLPSSWTGEAMRGRGAKTATFHMVAHTSKVCERYTHLYGVDGEMYADSSVIRVEDFATGTTTTYCPRPESLAGDGHGGHGGGDVGLIRQFVLAVDHVKNHGWSTDRAQRDLIGCTLEEVVRSHAIVFCAEEARRAGNVVAWPEWWAREVDSRMGGPC